MRLKETPQLPECLHLTDLFLFQTGAIKSESKTILTDNQLKGFYSKLVRLKVSRMLFMKLLINGFLFQTGAIKRESVPILRNRKQIQFLFQTGAIKRSSFRTRNNQPSMFLFQTGAIKRNLVLAIRGGRLYVSIPNWCD